MRLPGAGGQPVPLRCPRCPPDDDIDHVMGRVLDPAACDSRRATSRTRSSATGRCSTPTISRCAARLDRRRLRRARRATRRGGRRGRRDGFRVTPFARTRRPERTPGVRARRRRAGQGRDGQRQRLAQGPPPDGHAPRARGRRGGRGGRLGRPRWRSPAAAMRRSRPRCMARRPGATSMSSSRPTPTRPSSLVSRPSART